MEKILGEVDNTELVAGIATALFLSPLIAPLWASLEPGFTYSLHTCKSNVSNIMNCMMSSSSDISALHFFHILFINDAYHI
jgi:hypothetical protein